jgi:hypothetical protein
MHLGMRPVPRRGQPDPRIHPDRGAAGHQTAAGPAPPRRPARQLVHQAAVSGESDWRLESCRLSIGRSPQLRRILDQAPQAAAAGGPWAVRASRTPRGGLVAVGLYGPDWSLVLGATRPLPQPLLVILDRFGDDEPYDWNMLDPD